MQATPLPPEAVVLLVNVQSKNRGAEETEATAPPFPEAEAGPVPPLHPGLYPSTVTFWSNKHLRKTGAELFPR
jgi:hypothetical protein